MAKMPKADNSSTTTQPPSPTTTLAPNIPGAGGGEYTGNMFVTNQTKAGGIDPSYRPPTNDKFTDASNPYYYSTQDWQMLLSMSKDNVIAIQQKLMKAYPGFKPAVLGDRYDTSTIKYFKFALNRINQFTVDPTDSMKIRGKATVDQIGVLATNPMPASAGSSTSYTYKKSATEDLKAVFQQVAQKTLGRDIDAGSLNRMVEAYQQQEVQYQRRIAGGGTVTGTPTAETFAQNKIESDFGTEVDTRKLDNIFGAIDAAMSRGGQ